MSLNPKALGMALGALQGLVWFALMTLSLLSGIGIRTLTTIGSFHPFFSYSWGGMIVAVIEHLIIGYVLGWLLAKLYNNFLKQKQG